RGVRRPIGLVEARLINETYTGLPAGFANAVRHHQRMIETFDLAGAGDKNKGQVVADFDIANSYLALDKCLISCRHSTASIRATSSGLFSSQNSRPFASTSTQRSGVPRSRNLSCSKPSALSSWPSGQAAYALRACWR